MKAQPTAEGDHGGIFEGDIVDGVQVIPQAKIAELWDQHDSIWQW
ncbi:MAG: hypothetical protein V3U26_03540 [Dehalococcoidia bacterium]